MPIETSANYHHIRIKKPEEFSKNSFRFIVLGDGIKATIGCRKGYYRSGKCTKGTEIQSLLFPKDKFTRGEATEWMKKHPKIRVKRKRKK